METPDDFAYYANTLVKGETLVQTGVVENEVVYSAICRRHAIPYTITGHVILKADKIQFFSVDHSGEVAFHGVFNSHKVCISGHVGDDGVFRMVWNEPPEVSQLLIDYEY